ncbi:MAG: two component transcriptional regulator, LuxR family [Caulobacteraceae bacterium]|jgi:two-component system response regulator FixJ|nr:two component transcriptional regulator, LuxR family [Caulobacteraceae bacterium]
MVDKRLVHLVDDDEAIRESAAFLLEIAGYEVQVHRSGVAFLDVMGEALGEAQACCVLLDIHMPGLSGLDVQLKLNERGFTWPVIILTGQADIGAAIQAMKNGAFEFLEKPYHNAGLLEALVGAFTKSERSMEENAKAGHARALIARLSKRERQVMQGLLAALPNKLIAYEYDLSIRTVEIYRAKVMDKLEARGLSAAVRIAITAGLEPLEERRA